MPLPFLIAGATVARSGLGRKLGRMALRKGHSIGSRLVGGKGRGGHRRGFFSIGKRGVVGVMSKTGHERHIRTTGIAHIGKNLPKHKQIVRLRRNLQKHAADAATILRLVRPQSLRSPRHHMRYRRPYRHYGKRRR